MKKLQVLFIITIIVLPNFNSFANYSIENSYRNSAFVSPLNTNKSNSALQSKQVPKWHLIAKTSFYDRQPVPALGASYRIKNLHLGLGARYIGDGSNNASSVTPYVELGYNCLNNYSKFYIIPSISLFKYEFIEPWYSEDINLPVGKGEISLTTGVKWFFLQFNYLFIKDSKEFNLSKSKHLGASIGVRIKL